MTLTTVKASGGIPAWAGVLEPAAAIAQTVADTDFVPRPIRGNVPAITAAILYGDEIGVAPMAALQGIHVIDGRPFVGAETMRALVFGAGHSIHVLESTGTRCRVRGYRRDHPDHFVEIEWTMEMARAAGLAGKGNWNKYPRAMLIARATAELCRVLFPDVVRGLAQVPDNPPPELVEGWADVAASTGPDEPAPAAVESVQWTPRAPRPLGGQETAPSGSTTPPWDDEAIGAPMPAQTPDTTPAGPDYPAGPTPVADTDPPAAEDSGTRTASADLVRRILAAYSQLPFGPDRDTRLALYAALLGRPVESTKDLDRMTGYRLLGALNRLRTGETIAISDGHGGFTIHAGAEPPEGEES